MLTLFRRRNHTIHWQSVNVPKLRVDLNSLTLNSIACGQLADCLNFLGPGQHGTLRHEYRFPAHGVTLQIEKELLTAFHIHLQPTEEEREKGMKPFAGVVFHDNRPCSLGAKVGVANLIAALGSPSYFEETDEHRILMYATFKREWELILDRDGRVCTISVYK